MIRKNNKLNSLYYELEKLENKYLVMSYGCVAS